MSVWVSRDKHGFDSVCVRVGIVSCSPAEAEKQSRGVRRADQGCEDGVSSPASHPAAPRCGVHHRRTWEREIGCVQPLNT